MRKLSALAVCAGLLASCAGSPADGITSVQTMSTDGEAVYAAVDERWAGSRLVKFDLNGKQIWERGIGSSNDGGYIHGNHLWVVEDEPPGSEPPTTSTPDMLLKVDPQTGATVGSVVIGSSTDDPDLLIEGNLWLLSALDKRFDVVDPETVEVVEVLDVRIGGALEQPAEPFLGELSSPIRVDEYIYIIGSDPYAIIRYSIAERRIDSALEFDFLPLGRLELHAGAIWITDRVLDAVDPTEYLAHPLNLERFEFGTPVPFFESPMLSLTTDESVFDQTGPNEITQIDRETGNVVRTIEGREPEFVLHNHLWLANLERIDIS